MTNTWSQVDTWLEASIDHARVIGPPVATTRMILQLFALRFLAAGEEASANIWRRVRNEAAHSHTGPLALTSPLKDLAQRVEDLFPELNGVFSQQLLPSLQSAESFLAGWILPIDTLGMPLKDDLQAFGQWFDIVCDSVIGRGVGGLQFATPRPVAELMVRLGAPTGTESIHDPCCGSGALLAASLAYLSRHEQRPQISGQEIDPGAAALARLRLFLLGGHKSRIRVGDALRRPEFVHGIQATDIWGQRQIVKGDELETFDVVLCDPPYGQRLGNVDFADMDQYRRFRYGRPGRTSSDMAFLQHAMACLEPHGRAVTLIPHGPLFRGGGDAEVRRNMLAGDVVDAVVGLPSGTLPGMPIEPAILICRPNKVEQKRVDHIVFIDASQRREALRSPSAWQSLADEIVSIYSNGTDVPSLARVVRRAEVQKHLFSLQPRRYVTRDDRADRIDARDALQEAAACEAEATRNALIMDQLLQQLDDAPRSSATPTTTDQSKRNAP